MKATQEKPMTTNVQSQYDLIKGDYTPEEALEIISYLLMKKINFHELRSFSQEIKFGKEDAASLKRMEELNLCKKEFQNLVKEAQQQGYLLRVNSKITIELI